MYRKLIFGTLVAVLLITGLAITPQSAKAGTNGQQLGIDVSCPYAPVLAEVRVTGYNQRGEYVSWPPTGFAKPNSKHVVTYGYWWIDTWNGKWVGKVYIQYKYAGINPYLGSPFSYYSVYVDVPNNYRFDIYPVAIDQNDNCLAWIP